MDMQCHSPSKFSTWCTPPPNWSEERKDAPNEIFSAAILWVKLKTVCFQNSCWSFSKQHILRQTFAWHLSPSRYQFYGRVTFHVSGQKGTSMADRYKKKCWLACYSILICLDSFGKGTCIPRKLSRAEFFVQNMFLSLVYIFGRNINFRLIKKAN